MTSGILTGFLNNSFHRFNSNTLHEEDYTLLQTKSRAGRDRFLTGRILLRALIAELTGEEASEITIAVDSNGQPRHVHPHPVRFSITHAGNLTAIAAVSSDSAWGLVGIDMEERNTDRNLDAIAEAWFHPLECRMLDKAENLETRTRLFYKLWTAKEAWVKARGLSVWNIGSMPPLKIIDEDGSGLWLELPGNYTLALYFQDMVKIDDLNIFEPSSGMENLRSRYAGSFKFYTGDRT